MTKMIDATCTSGVVTADGVPVPSAEILSGGVGQSSGVLLLDEDRAAYLANIEPDLSVTLDKLSTALGSIASALNKIDTKVLSTTCPAGSGATLPLPLAASDIATIQTAKTAIDALKGTLR